MGVYGSESGHTHRSGAPNRRLMYMMWKESVGYGVVAMGCFQISSERMEILVPTRMISGENTAKMVMLLATSAAPGASGPT